MLSREQRGGPPCCQDRPLTATGRATMLTLPRRRRSGAQRTSAQKQRSRAEALVQKSQGEKPPTGVGGSAARLFPGSRRLPASRSLPGSGAEPSRLWRGELSLRGAFSGPGTESCRCAERCPHIRRSTLRAARSLRGNDGERSAIMPQTTENAPRSCSGAGTLRDHAAERELTANTGQAIPNRRHRARLAPQEPHRITL